MTHSKAFLRSVVKRNGENARDIKSKGDERRKSKFMSLPLRITIASVKRVPVYASHQLDFLGQLVAPRHVVVSWTMMNSFLLSRYPFQLRSAVAVAWEKRIETERKRLREEILASTRCPRGEPWNSFLSHCHGTLVTLEVENWMSFSIGLNRLLMRASPGHSDCREVWTLCAFIDSRQSK